MLKKIKRCITYLLMITIGLTIVPFKTVSAGNYDNDSILEGEYVVISKLSNKSMEVANYGGNVGDLIQQWTYGGALQQQWSFQKVTDKYYKIVSKISGKVIEVKDSLTYDGAIIQQNDFFGTDNQLWYFEKDSNGYIKIKSKQSEKCLDIKDYSSNDGAKLQLWTDNDGDNQKWNLRKMSDDIVSGNEYIITSKSSNKLMEVENNSLENAALIQQWDYDNSRSQTWVLTEVQDGFFTITSSNSGKVADVKNTDTYDGATIYQWEYNGQDNQLWYFEMDNDGYYEIKSKQSGKCLDISGMSANNGAKLQIWSDCDGDNQKWKIERVREVNEVLTGGNLQLPITLEDDTDGDGIINSEELKYGTKCNSIDSDDDYLTDYEEIFIFNTDPLRDDTDGDGISDGAEVRLGSNPLEKDELKSEYSLNVNNEELGVSLLVNGTVDAVTTTNISKVEDKYFSNTLSILGDVLEFYTKEEINNAQVTINYDSDELISKQLNEDALSIYYINEDELKLEKIESVVNKDNKTVSAKLKHFSKYIVADSSKIITDLNSIDVVFVIDKSGSMSSSDPKSERINVCKNFVNNLNGDNCRYGIVSFNSSASAVSFGSSPTTYLTSDTVLVKNKLDSLKGVASGGTNIANALDKATSMFNKDSRKIIVLLTDGVGSGDINSAMKKVKANNIQVYTVGLGSDVDVSLLKDKIAVPSSGKYFHAKDYNYLLDIFTEIKDFLVPPKTTTITLRQDEVESNNKEVKVKVIADSGFKPEIDGYSFENFDSNYGEDGQCFGISVTSILHYLNKLPLKSSVLDSNVEFDYDLSDNNIFSNGMKLYQNINLGSNIGYIDYEDHNDAYISYLGQDKEIIKSIMWWNRIQEDDLQENDFISLINYVTKLDIVRGGAIGYLSSGLEKAPMEINFCDFKFKEMHPVGDHSVVATSLYQDKDDSLVYYLGIYDSNYPGHEEYIKIEQKYCFYNGMIKTTLDTVRKSYIHTDYFHSTNLDKVYEYIK